MRITQDGVRVNTNNKGAPQKSDTTGMIKDRGGTEPVLYQQRPKEQCELSKSKYLLLSKYTKRSQICLKIKA